MVSEHGWPFPRGKALVPGALILPTWRQFAGALSSGKHGGKFIIGTMTLAAHRLHCPRRSLLTSHERGRLISRCTISRAKP